MNAARREQRSWRAGRQSKSNPKTARWVGGLLGLAAVGLGLFFLIRVWLNPKADHSLVLVAVTERDELVVPSNQLAVADLAELSKNFGVERRKKQMAPDLALLPESWKSLPETDKNALIVYLSAHAIAFKEESDFKVYVAASDYPTGDTGSIGKDPNRRDGLVELMPILEDLAKHQSAIKVLFLDAGRMDYDPRLGFVGNPFASMLAQSVQSLENAENLFVVVSHGPFRINEPLYGTRHSLFGMAVNRALTGNGSEPKDRYVTMGKLYTYLRTYMYRQTPRQIPLLLQGGKGLVQKAPDDDQHRLVRLDPDLRAIYPAESDEESESEEETVENAELQSDPALTQARLDLNKAWRLRDRIATENDFTPLDFAPHIWRQVNAQLLNLEGQFHINNIATPAAVADLALLTKSLERLECALTAEVDLVTTAGDAPLAKPLLSAWSRYYREVLQKRVPNANLAVASNAYRKYLKQIFEVVYFMRLHGRQNRGDRPFAAAALRRQLAALLAFRRKLDEFQQEAQVSGSRLEALATVVSDMDAANRSLHQQLKSKIRTLKPGDAKANTKLQETAAWLLSTPLLRSEQREPLLEMLALAPNDLKRARPPKAEASLAPLSEHWVHLQNQIGLEGQFVKLIGLDANKVATPQLGTGSTEERWSRIAASGQALMGLYGSMLSEIQRSYQTPSSAAVDEMLVAIDERDSGKIDEARFRFPTLPFKLQKEAWLKFTGTRRTQLQRGGINTVTIPFEASHAEILKYLEKANVTLSTDKSWASVRDHKWGPISSVPGKFTRLMTWNVETHKGRLPKLKGRCELTLRVRWRFRDSADQIREKISAVLPGPDDVQIVYLPTPDSKGVLLNEELPLRPLPNQKTQFRFGVRNLSGRARNLRVSMYAVPRPRTPIVATGDPFPRAATKRYEAMAANGSLATIVRNLAVAVDASTSVVQLNLAPPKPADDAKKAKKKGPSPNPGKSLGIDTTSAIMFVVEDPAAGTKPTHTIVPLKPLSPRDYLTAKMEYERTGQNEGMLRAEVRYADRDGSGKPDIPIEQKIFWRSPQPSQGTDIASLTPDDPIARLNSEASPSSKPYFVDLDVGGYPRAFSFRTQTDIPAVGGKVTGKALHNAFLKTIRLVRLSTDTNYEAYVPQPDGRILKVKTEKKETGDDGKKKAPVTPAFIKKSARSEDSVVVFPRSKRLVVDFRADTPNDAFKNGGRLELIVAHNDINRRFLADRQILVTATRIMPTGVLELDCKISDFRVDVSILGLATEAKILARYIDGQNAQNEQNVVDSHAINILVDSAPPEVTRMQISPQKVEVNTPVKVIFDVKDVSGIRLLRLGVDKNNDGKLDPGDMIEPVEMRSVSREQSLGRNKFQYRVAMPLRDIKPGQYQLIAELEDYVGQKSKVMKGTIEIKPVLTTLRVAVRHVRHRLSTVRVTGTGPDGQKFDRDLKDFRLPDLKPGKYEFFATANGPDGKLSGKGSVEVPMAKSLTIRVEYKK